MNIARDNRIDIQAIGQFNDRTEWKAHSSGIEQQKEGKQREAFEGCCAAVELFKYLSQIIKERYIFRLNFNEMLKIICLPKITVQNDYRLLLHTGTLALVHSTAEYCAPVGRNSAHTHKVDVKTNQAMRTVSGSTKLLPWLPVLANIAPPPIRREAAANTEFQKYSLLQNSLIYNQFQLIPQTYYVPEIHPGQLVIHSMLVTSRS
nr:unnamed protein product [Callosobruchus analis]